MESRDSPGTDDDTRGSLRSSYQSGNRRRPGGTHNLDPEPAREREHYSDGERSSGSFYSDNYENVSSSEHSLPRQSPSHSPPPRRSHDRRASNQTGHRKVGTGIRVRGPHQGVARSKESPPKDLDLVTKRLLSARLLKINELKNALAELRLHGDELQRENRLLRQLQQRHEKALHRYGDTEHEIGELLARHGNETHALRERLRRAHEQQRAAERARRDADEKLRRGHEELARLRKLAGDRRLGEREELARQLALTQEAEQEGGRRIKELERSMELSASSFQRQLGAERRKTHEVQEEARALREELERLNVKLKEKERELDTRNIYANRMKGPKRDLDSTGRRKAPNSSSSSSSKAVQTEDRSLSLDFPSPPPDITSGNQLPEHGGDDYLSLKQELEDVNPGTKSAEGQQQVEGDLERKRDGEREGKEQLKNERQSGEETKKTRGFSVFQEGEKAKEDEDKRGRSLETQNGSSAESKEKAERRRKEQLLAKMHEIDMQNEPRNTGLFFSDSGENRGSSLSPQNQATPIFGSAELKNDVNARGGTVERGSGPGSGGQRGALRAQNTSEEDSLSFGSYAPSFGRPMQRSGLQTRPRIDPSPNTRLDAGLDLGLDLGGVVKERKSSLMQQLFGSTTESPTPTPQTTSPPPASKGATVGRRRDVEVVMSSSRGSLQVTESRPAVRAITTFDDDIEELTL
ncbi:lebercilin [Denticeps clupeoides]|uniref:lebercilin n=1 Tax=Denticeps clupeoides TaxID=299321 RepID=UPI0010A48812|nr:lebercilin [Denticeps clupeoides]